MFISKASALWIFLLLRVLSLLLQMSNTIKNVDWPTLNDSDWDVSILSDNLDKENMPIDNDKTIVNMERSVDLDRSPNAPDMVVSKNRKRKALSGSFNIPLSNANNSAAKPNNDNVDTPSKVQTKICNNNKLRITVRSNDNLAPKPVLLAQDSAQAIANMGDDTLLLTQPFHNNNILQSSTQKNDLVHDTQEDVFTVEQQLHMLRSLPDTIVLYMNKQFELFNDRFVEQSIANRSSILELSTQLFDNTTKQISSFFNNKQSEARINATTVDYYADSHLQLNQMGEAIQVLDNKFNELAQHCLSWERYLKSFYCDIKRDITRLSIAEGCPNHLTDRLDIPSIECITNNRCSNAKKFAKLAKNLEEKSTLTHEEEQNLMKYQRLYAICTATDGDQSTSVIKELVHRQLCLDDRSTQQMDVDDCNEDAPKSSSNKGDQGTIVFLDPLSYIIVILQITI